MREKFSMFKDESINNILRSNGKSKHPDDINILEMFYSEYKTVPFIFTFSNRDNTIFVWDILLEKLNEKYDFRVLFQEESIILKNNIKYYKQQTLKLRDGLMLQLEGTIKSETYPFYELKGEDENINVVTYSMFLMNDFISDEEQKEITSIFEQSKLIEKDTVNIGMISYDNGSYYVKDFDIKESILELESFDLHYGNGFQDFSDKLIERLLTKTKGLTLFHGDPGTGKTTFLRYLLKKIIENNKLNHVLYFPPTMVDSITDPSFMNFISEWVSNNEGKTFLLIEDAEPLLESRNQSRNLGITNLLNLTDGILNDILNIQIIATFNTKLQNIDKALLRPERLLARKEFNILSKENAIKLSEHLGIDLNLINNKMSLAEIYSLKKDSKPLTHDISSDGDKISF